MVFNTEKILSGTDHKILVREFNNLKEDYTRLNAIKYSHLYENKNLSEILNDSEYIFPESYKGYKFYKNIMETATIPYDQYDIQLDKVNSYIQEHGSKMSSKQLNEFQELSNVIQKRKSDNINAINLYSEMVLETSDDSMALYDGIYAGYNKLITESEMHSIVRNSLTSNKCQFMDIMNCLSDKKRFNEHLNLYLESCYVYDAVEPDDVVNNSNMKNMLERMMKDETFYENVNNMRNTNLRYNIIGLSQISDVDILDNIKYEHVNVYDEMYSNMDNAIERIYMDMCDKELVKEDCKDERLTRLESEIALYETTRDYISYDLETNNNQDTYTGNDLGFKTITESTNSNSSTIDTILAMNNIIDQLKEEYISESNGGTSKYISKMMPDGAKDSKFNKRLSDAKKAKYKITNDEDDDDDDDNFDDPSVNPFSVKARNKRHKKNKIHAVAKSDDEDDDDDDRDIDDKKDNDEDDENDTIDKPNGGVVRGIESGIVNINSKINKGASKVKQGITHGKSIVRGATEIPRSAVTGVQNFVQDIQEMDDNRRKEWMMKSGNRSKLINNLNTAIQYGVTASINPLYIPLLAFYRTNGRTKNRRLYNEMKYEIESEIKILQMKIDDARSAGDNQASYELTRTKAKFEYQLKRLKLNSKYIRK